MLTDFTRFVIAPERSAAPSRSYGAAVTCMECGWSGKAGLTVHEVQSLRCPRCGNMERSYAGIPDEFVGVPCPACAEGKTQVEYETAPVGGDKSLRLSCAGCGWQL